MAYGVSLRRLILLPYCLTPDSVLGSSLSAIGDAQEFLLRVRVEFAIGVARHNELLLHDSKASTMREQHDCKKRARPRGTAQSLPTGPLWFLPPEG